MCFSRNRFWRSCRSPKQGQNQFGFWNFLGLKLVLLFLVVLVPGFIHFLFLTQKKWSFFFLVVLVSGFIDLSGSSTVPGDARSTLHTAQSICCSLRCFQLMILLFSKLSLFQFHLVVFSGRHFFLVHLHLFRNWLISVRSCF